MKDRVPLHTWLMEGRVTVNMFVGDMFVTALRSEEIRTISLKLDSNSDVTDVVNNKFRLRRTKQFRAMAFLGFKQNDGAWFVHDTSYETIWLRLEMSRITNIVVNGISCTSFTMETEYDKELAQLYFDAVKEKEMRIQSKVTE